MYLLFAGSSYYPSGGMDDFIDSFETREEAEQAGGGYDWYHITTGSVERI